MSLLNLWNKAKEQFTNVKDAVLQTTPMEKKVRDATENNSWGPNVSEKREIAEASLNYTNFKEIMGVLWKRIGEEGKNHKSIQKALTLIAYLIINGSENTKSEVKMEMYSIRKLTTFYYTDEKGRECGGGVRSKAKEITKLLRDNDYFQKCIKESKKTKNRFQGISKSEVNWSKKFGNDRDEEYEKKVTQKRMSPPSDDENEEYIQRKKSPVRKVKSKKIAPVSGSSSESEVSDVDSDETDSDDDEPSSIQIRKKPKRSPKSKTKITIKIHTTDEDESKNKMRRPSLGKKDIPSIVPFSVIETKKVVEKKVEPLKTPQVEERKRTNGVSLMSFFDNQEEQPKNNVKDLLGFNDNTPPLDP